METENQCSLKEIIRNQVFLRSWPSNRAQGFLRQHRRDVLEKSILNPQYDPSEYAQRLEAFSRSTESLVTTNSDHAACACIVEKTRKLFRNATRTISVFLLEIKDGGAAFSTIPHPYFLDPEKLFITCLLNARQASMEFAEVPPDFAGQLPGVELQDIAAAREALRSLPRWQKARIWIRSRHRLAPCQEALLPSLSVTPPGCCIRDVPAECPNLKPEATNRDHERPPTPQPPLTNGRKPSATAVSSLEPTHLVPPSPSPTLIPPPPSSGPSSDPPAEQAEVLRARVHCTDRLPVRFSSASIANHDGSCQGSNNIQTKHPSPLHSLESISESEPEPESTATSSPVAAPHLNTYFAPAAAPTASSSSSGFGSPIVPALAATSSTQDGYIPAWAVGAFAKLYEPLAKYTSYSLSLSPKLGQGGGESSHRCLSGVSVSSSSEIVPAPVQLPTSHVRPGGCQSFVAMQGQRPFENYESPWVDRGTTSNRLYHPYPEKARHGNVLQPHASGSQYASPQGYETAHQTSTPNFDACFSKFMDQANQGPTSSGLNLLWTKEAVDAGEHKKQEGRLPQSEFAGISHELTSANNPVDTYTSRKLEHTEVLTTPYQAQVPHKLGIESEISLLAEQEETEKSFYGWMSKDTQAGSTGAAAVAASSHRPSAFGSPISPYSAHQEFYQASKPEGGSSWHPQFAINPSGISPIPSNLPSTGGLPFIWSRQPFVNSSASKEGMSSCSFNWQAGYPTPLASQPEVIAKPSEHGPCGDPLRLPEFYDDAQSNRMSSFDPRSVEDRPSKQNH